MDPASARALTASLLGTISGITSVLAMALWADHTTGWWTLASPALAGLALGALGMGLGWQAAQTARRAGERPNGAVLAAGLLGLLAILGGATALLSISVTLRYFEELAKTG